MDNTVKFQYVVQRIVIFFIVIGLLLFLGNYLSDIIPLFFFAFLFAYLLNPLVDRLEFIVQKRLVAVIGLYFLSFTGLVFLFNYIIPLIVFEFNDLTVRLPYYLANFQDFYAIFTTKIETSIPIIKQTQILENFQTQIQTFVVNAAQFIPTLFISTFSTLSYGLLIPIILFFFLYQGPEMKRSFFKLIPNTYFEVTMNLFYSIGDKLGNYLRGIFIETLIIGILSLTVMFFLGVEYSVLLALIAAVANIIPYLGPVIGALPALILFYLQVKTVNMVLYLLIGFVVIQLLDNIILKPVIYSQSVDLHPLTVLFFLLLGGSLAGVWGLILAVPIGGILKVTVTILAKKIKFRMELVGEQKQ